MIVLTEIEQAMLSYALGLAQEKNDDFTEEDQEALDSLKRLIDPQ